MKNIFWIILVLIIIIFAGTKYFHPTPKTFDPEKLPGLETGTIPWMPEIAHLRQRLSMINLPALSAEGAALHTHQHLDIFINGLKVDVPGGIGIGPNDSYISPIHTHDTTGFIHVESPTVKDYDLGQFFDIWGVRLNDRCIGGYCTTGGNKLKIFSNGGKITNNFRSIKLTVHQEIVIFYGTDSQLPQPVPASFTFPADY